MVLKQKMYLIIEYGSKYKQIKFFLKQINKKFETLENNFSDYIVHILQYFVQNVSISYAFLTHCKCTSNSFTFSCDGHFSFPNKSVHSKNCNIELQIHSNGRYMREFNFWEECAHI